MRRVHAAEISERHTQLSQQAILMLQLLRRWLVVAALAVASAWVYLFATSATQLRMLFDGLDDASAVSRAADDRARPSPVAVGDQSTAVASTPAEPAAGPQAERDSESLSGALGAAQIMQLLEDEITTETDPAAADELLRAFGQSIEPRE